MVECKDFYMWNMSISQLFGYTPKINFICGKCDSFNEDRIPIDYQTAAMAEQFNMNLVTAALNGGEDYELLFTVPLTDHDKVSEMKGVKVIGHITKPDLGNYLVGRDGGEVELKAQGWNSLEE